MSVRVGPAVGGGPIPEDRGQAIKRIIAQREAAAPQTQATAPTEAAPAAPPDPEVKPAGLPPEALIEIERRERELDRYKHEISTRDTELARLREADADGKDVKKLLARYGHSMDDVVQMYLSNDDKLHAGQTASEPKKPTESSTEYMTRLEQLERRLATEDAQRQRAARIAQIKDLTPEGDDFEVLRAMDWHEDFMSRILETQEREQKRQIGPQETAKLLKDYESRSRQNIEVQLTQLAKTKYGRTVIARLLSGVGAESSQASQPAEANPAQPATSQPDEWSQGRAFRLRRDSRELREELRRKSLERLR